MYITYENLTHVSMIFISESEMPKDHVILSNFLR